MLIIIFLVIYGAFYQLWSEAFLHTSLGVKFYLILLTFFVIAVLSISNLQLKHVVHKIKVKKHQLLVYDLVGVLTRY